MFVLASPATTMHSMLNNPQHICISGPMYHDMEDQPKQNDQPFLA
jgi:hypothetical protein